MRRRESKQSKVRSYKQQKQKEQARRNILLIIGGVVVLAVIAVVVLVIQNNRPPEVVGSFNTVEKKDWPQADGMALGPENASVLIREFADYQCPYCREFDRTVQQQIIDQYVKTGKVRYEFRNFIVIDQNVGGTESLHAALAAMCANEQGQFWNYHEMLYANQASEGSGAFSDGRLKAFAQSLGLDTAKFNSCLESQRYSTKVTQDQAMGTSLGIQGTPSLFVNGKMVQNPLDFNAVKTAIDAAAAGK